MPFCFRIGETDYADDFGKSISNEEFYKLTSGGAKVKTSQISSGRYVEFFEPFLKDGKDVLHVTLSSGLSGTYESCLSAKKELEAKYPERKVYVIDSLCGSMGYGMLVLSAADYRDEGRSAAEIAALLEEDRKKVKAFYFTPDLSAFIRGGRLSPRGGFHRFSFENSSASRRHGGRKTVRKKETHRQEKSDKRIDCGNEG